MKYTLCSLLLMGGVIFFSPDASAQRYLTEVFDQVEVQPNIEYSSNFTVITGAPVMESLRMDVYTPANDTETERPLIILLHTGSFLPRYLNQLPTGERNDSATVEMCRRFAKKGYVAAAISYRRGWNPAAPTEDGRKESIIRAVYRSMQDTKAAVRYFRRSIAEEANPYGIDGSRIVLGGQGSGGYVVLAYATLQDVSEIQLLKFFNSETNQFMVDPTVLGDFEGLGGNSALNNDNHPGYPTDISMVFNIGGALGDSTWLEQGEVPICCVHGVFDPFAPFRNGTVFVPGTNFAVVNVDGSGRITELANEYGNNDVWLSPPFTDPVTQYAQAVLDTLHGGINAGDEGLFPITRAQNSSGPWEWWDEGVVTAGATTMGVDPQVVIANGYATNPVFQALGPVAGRARALAYIDTLQAFITPRIFRVLDLSVGLPEHSAISQGVDVFPNPAHDRINITSSAAMIEHYVIYDQQGRIVRNGSVNAPQAILDRKGLNAGGYFIELHFEEGRVIRKLILD